MCVYIYIYIYIYIYTQYMYIHTVTFEVDKKNHQSCPKTTFLHYIILGFYPLQMFTTIYIYIYVCVCVYVYIYIDRFFNNI